MRKAPGEKGRDSSPVVRPPTTKEKKKMKKTIAQALRIVSQTPDLQSSSCESGPNRPYNPALKPKEPKDTSDSPQVETFRLGPSSFQPQPDFVGLRVVHEPEEVRDMNYLKVGLLRRHRKRLYDPIDL